LLFSENKWYLHGCSNHKQEYRSFKDRMPRKKFGSKSDEVEEDKKGNYILQGFRIYTLHPAA
jgi:hypothetical protein